MKLVASLATLLLVAAAGVIIFEACNKKHEMVKNIPELNATELSDMDKEMLLFGEKMKSAQKGGETMPLEEAVRNLTNYQNFRLCDASKHSSDMERFTIETEIPVNDGNVYLSDIYSIYESNKKQIREKLASLEGEDKAIYCVFNRIVNDNKDDNDVRIITVAYMYRYIPINIQIDINDTDHWYSGLYLGKCGPYVGQNVGKDAVTRLDEIIKSMVTTQTCTAGYRLVLYDYDGYWFFSEDWDDTNSPNGHYGLIHYDYENYCLSPDDMRYYRNNILDKYVECVEEQSNSDRILVLIEYLEFPVSTILHIEFAQSECTFVGFDD